MNASSSSRDIRAVNLLYFIVLCLMAANIFLTWLPQYARLALNEILLVFLPGVIYLRLRPEGQGRNRQSATLRVRWRWPGGRTALLSLAVGAGLYPVSAASAGVLMVALGYTNFAAPADAIPTTVEMGALAVLSYAVLAPLCEEFLFRGVIQPVYEARGAGWGVLFVGFLFVAFHLSLLQGLSILLLALALGYVNYRTRSLPASMLTHFGANSLAALVVTQRVFPTGIQNWITSIPALMGGLLLAGAALLALARLPRGAAPEALAADAPAGVEGAAPAQRLARWLSAGWPLLAALLLYAPVVGMEWVYSRAPAQTAALHAPGPALRPGPSPWSEAQAWRYEIRNAAGDPVGEGECRLNPAGQVMELTCDSTVKAYEVKHGGGTYASSGGRRVDTLRWEAADGRFISGASVLDLAGGFHSQVNFRLGEDRIEVRYQEMDQPEKRLDLAFQQTALSGDPTLPLAVDYTWPWMLAGICAPDWADGGTPGGGTPGGVVRFHPFTWNDAARSSGPLAEAQRITITVPAGAQAPAGNFQACMAARGDRDTAWYAEVGGTLAVVKYFNGVETWYLKP